MTRAQAQCQEEDIEEQLREECGVVTNQLEVREKGQQLVGEESGYEDNTAVERLDSDQTVERLVLEGDDVCLFVTSVLRLSHLCWLLSLCVAAVLVFAPRTGHARSFVI